MPESNMQRRYAEAAKVNTISLLLRQTQLQFTSDGHLGIDKHPQHALVIQSSNAFILRLPNEILQQILELAAIPDTSSWNRSLAEYSDAVPLTRVCRLFYALSVSILYRSFISASGLNDPTAFIPPGASTRLLHRTLKENPALRSHCRKLQIHRKFQHRGSSEAGWRTAYDIISWSSNVTSLTMYGGFHEGETLVWDMLEKAVACMPNIQQLAFWRQDLAGLTLKSIVDLTQPAQLQELSIHGGARRSDGHSFVCPVDKQRTATFTTLDMSDISEYPSGIKQFLLWPKKLEHFSFMDTDASRNQLSTAQIGAFLAPHKEHLKTLDLVSLYSHEKSCLDVSDFPSLTNITIGFYDVECAPEEAASKLLGPQVSFFGWSWILCGQTQPGVDDLGTEQIDWLTRLVKAAKARKSMLRRVHINFQPEYWGYFNAEQIRGAEPVYPFDRLDQLAGDLATLGVMLTYEEPRLTKAEFQSRLLESLKATGAAD